MKQKKRKKKRTSKLNKEFIGSKVGPITRTHLNLNLHCVCVCDNVNSNNSIETDQMIYTPFVVPIAMQTHLHLLGMPMCVSVGNGILRSAREKSHKRLDGFCWLYRLGLNEILE